MKETTLSVVLYQQIMNRHTGNCKEAGTQISRQACKLGGKCPVSGVGCAVHQGYT